MHKDIEAYNQALSEDRRKVCELLAKELIACLPKAENKVWHGHPVWFIDGNPVAGYADRKDSVQLLFWSGQSFDEPGLNTEGSFKAAEARFNHPSDIKLDDLRRWLKKSEDIQWDYKNIVKRRGVLERLK